MPTLDPRQFARLFTQQHGDAASNRSGEQLLLTSVSADPKAFWTTMIQELGRPVKTASPDLAPKPPSEAAALDPLDPQWIAGILRERYGERAAGVAERRILDLRHERQVEEAAAWERAIKFIDIGSASKVEHS
jgi:hypothetical protein